MVKDRAHCGLGVCGPVRHSRLVRSQRDGMAELSGPEIGAVDALSGVAERLAQARRGVEQLEAALGELVVAAGAQGLTAIELQEATGLDPGEVEQILVNGKLSPPR